MGAILSLGIGCSLGLLANAGFAIIFAYLGWSELSLVPVALVIMLCDRPVEKYNAIRSAQFRRTGVLRAIFYTLALPFLLFFLWQWAVYSIAKAIIT